MTITKKTWVLVRRRDQERRRVEGFVLDEVGLIRAGSVDGGSSRGLAAAAGSEVDTAEEGAKNTHGKL